MDLMNIQILQFADLSLNEIKGKFGFHRMEEVDPAECLKVASFLDAKNAETREKIARLEKVSQLLELAAETLRDLNHESDQRLAAFVREIYQTIRRKENGIPEEGCFGHED